MEPARTMKGQAMAPSASYEGFSPALLRHGDPTSIEAQWGLRKLVVEQTETLRDDGTPVERPILHITASAVVKNPWIGRGTSSELVVSPQHIAARLSRLLADRILVLTHGPQAIEAFGKGAIIGEAGELEHGAAIMHTPYFASHLRTFFDGSAVISFSDTRGAPGEPLTIPLCEKQTGIHRDHYQSVRVRIPDAPLPDEIVLIAAISTGPRPFPRVGDRTTDLPLDTSLMNGVFE